MVILHGQVTISGLLSYSLQKWPVDFYPSILGTLEVANQVKVKTMMTLGWNGVVSKENLNFLFILNIFRDNKINLSYREMDTDMLEVHLTHLITEERTTKHEKVSHIFCL